MKKLLKNPFVIILILLGVLCACCFVVFLFTFGPLNPSTIATQQKHTEVKAQLDSLCSDPTINSTMRKDLICKLPNFVDGCNNKDSSACIDFYTPNDINVSFTKFGDNNDYQLLSRGADSCLGLCGADGGHLENFAFAYKDKFVGYLRLFTNWKYTTKVAWIEKNGSVYFYLYDDQKLGNNVTGGNVIFKYNRTEDKLYAAMFQNFVYGDDVKLGINKVYFNQDLELVMEGSGEPIILKNGDYKEQKAVSDYYYDQDYLFKYDSLLEIPETNY